MTSTDLINIMSVARNDPTQMMSLVFQALEAVSDGKVRFVDPNNPVAYTIEIAIAAAAIGLAENQTLNRRQYPAAAQTYSDLYLHMSDKDYLNRFSSPGQAPVSMLIAYDEFLNKVVPDTRNPGTSKLTIPRQTEFSVGGLLFTMQYPIDIQLMPHGGLNVTFDTSIPSPIYAVTTNIVNWQFIYQGPTKYILLTFPVYQMQMVSSVAQLNNAIGFNKIYNFSDNFFYCRAYSRSPASGAQWSEIATTHTAQVYDPTIPTVVLQVLNGQLSVTIPQYYFNVGLIPDSVRIDIYTTTGVVNLNLQNFPSISANYRDLDTTDKNLFSAPLVTFANMQVFSTGVAEGGKGPLTFAELRNQVIVGGLAPNGVPITNAQLSTTLADSGYALVTNIDNITDRMFLATRTVPAPTDGSTISGAGCAIQTYSNTLENIATLPTAHDGSAYVVLKPDTLYQSIAGVLGVVPNSQVQALLNPVVTPPAALANQVNNGNYLYSPFHYVLDVSTSEFRARPYMLSTPKVTSKLFVQSNVTAQVAVASAAQEVSLTPDGSGYTLTITLNTGALWGGMSVDNIHTQLSFVEPHSTARVWFDGTLVSQIDSTTGLPVQGVYIYQFDIGTGFIVDGNNNLVLTATGAPLPLTQAFDLVYIVQNYLPAGTTYGPIDAIVNASELLDYNPTTTYLGVSQESITINFGAYLQNLWANSRSIAAPYQYQKYSADVPAIYPKDVYVMNSAGTPAITHNSSTGVTSATIRHHTGDPVLDSSGLPVMAHYAGDNVLDGSGLPIPIGGATRQILRQFDMFLIDGSYFFANDAVTTGNLAAAIKSVVGWVTGDISNLSKLLLERSQLFFYPMSSIGTIQVQVDGGSTATVNTEQNLVVTYSVPAATYNDPDLRTSITRSTSSTIATVLKQPTISHVDITTALRDIMGSDILSVAVSGFMNNMYDIVTMVDSSAQPTIGKELVVLSSLELQVQDSVVVNFVRHGR